MAAAPVMATFTGFVATTVDAALLVQAAIAGKLPHVATRPDNVRYRQLARSGTVVVFGPKIRRWREGLAWTPRRALGNGFDVYRQKTSDVDDRLTHKDKWKERLCREVVAPFVGPNVADGTCKREGLVKKTIAFTIGDERWGLVAYYKIADVASKVLLRPRDDPVLGRMLLAGGLSPEFWRQGGKRSARARVVVMVDDGNVHPAARSPLWVRAQPVGPGQFAPQPAANVFPVAPFVGLVFAPPPVPSQQLALSAAGGNSAASSGPVPSGPATSGPAPSGPARSAPDRSAPARSARSRQQQQDSHQSAPAAAAAAGVFGSLPLRSAPAPSAGVFLAPSFPAPSFPPGAPGPSPDDEDVSPVFSPPAGDDDFLPAEDDVPFSAPAPFPGPDGGVEVDFGIADWIDEVPRLLDEMFPPPPPAPAAAGDAGVGGGGDLVDWEEEAARVMDQIAQEGELEFTEEDVLRFMGGEMDGDGDVVMEDV